MVPSHLPPVDSRFSSCLDHARDDSLVSAHHCRRGRRHDVRVRRALAHHVRTAVGWVGRNPLERLEIGNNDHHVRRVMRPVIVRGRLHRVGIGVAAPRAAGRHHVADADARDLRRRLRTCRPRPISSRARRGTWDRCPRCPACPADSSSRWCPREALPARRLPSRASRGSSPSRRPTPAPRSSRSRSSARASSSTAHRHAACRHRHRVRVRRLARSPGLRHAARRDTNPASARPATPSRYGTYNVHRVLSFQPGITKPPRTVGYRCACRDVTGRAFRS